MPLVKDNAVVEDTWIRLESVSGPLPDGDIIIPFSYWREHPDEFTGREGRLGVCLNGDDEPEELVAKLKQFDLVALDFPVFKDGRCYSHARLLRERYGYEGELRAVGEVLRDQLFFMKRCGINSFQIADDRDVDDVLKGFSDFSVTYQTAADGAQPVYKQRHSA